jgi:hypothetical protein
MDAAARKKTLILFGGKLLIVIDLPATRCVVAGKRPRFLSISPSPRLRGERGESMALEVDSQ